VLPVQEPFSLEKILGQVDGGGKMPIKKNVVYTFMNLIKMKLISSRIYLTKINKIQN
jgi:hypothetical protein